MNHFLRNTMMMASLVAASHKTIAQSDEPQPVTVSATMGYMNFMGPAAHTQHPVTVGLMAKKPLNSIFPAAVFAAFDVGVLGKVGSERKGLTNPVINGDGRMQANLALGGELNLNFVDNDDEQFGLVVAASQNFMLTKPEDNKDKKFAINGIPKFNFGLRYTNNKVDISASFGKWFRRAALANNYVADPNAAITGNQWLDDPGNAPTFFEVKAGFHLFN